MIKRRSDWCGFENPIVDPVLVSIGKLEACLFSSEVLVSFLLHKQVLLLGKSFQA